LLGCVVLALAAAAPAGAQPLQQRVDAVAAKAGVTWITYRVPMIGGPRRMCCFDSPLDRGATCCGRCRLERGDGVAMSNPERSMAGDPRIVLEAPSEMRLFARLENGIVTRVRTFSLDCDVDAEGAVVVTLENIASDDSVGWLAGVIRSSDSQERRDAVQLSALSALALHPGARPNSLLVSLARDDQRPRIRSQALFWLAQRAGDQALGTIRAAVNDDPEIDVKRRAVFALSQLPRDEGVPMLIDLARTHRLPEVRRQAMFWLGQSRDPRAVQFFEQILRAK
jgi:hypothetical protein